MPLKVHLLEAPELEALADLQSHLAPEVQVTTGPTLPTPADYHILVAGRPERAHLAGSPNLRALVVPWAGMPENTLQLVADFPDIAVHNLHHNAAATAEVALALLLAAAKFIVPFDRALRKHDWTPRYQPSPVIQLEGKTVLVLGYGSIGQRVARACQALSMQVLATRRHPGARGPADITAEIHPPDHLHSLLPRTNALIITLPLTAETQGLIGATELALLPPGAVLVNVGRGPIVDEAALYHALRRSSLSAAALDVWYSYPKQALTRRHTRPSKYPFHKLDNVVMSPHRAGGSTEDEKHRMAHLANLLNAAARGESMPNRVDLHAGY